jgi:hypothetical protein
MVQIFECKHFDPYLELFFSRNGGGQNTNILHELTSVDLIVQSTVWITHRMLFPSSWWCH